MADLDAAIAQLEDELGDLAARLGGVLGADIQLAVVGRAQDRTDGLVAEIVDGDQADATASDVLALLWPDDPPLSWWRTPLGLLCAPTAAQEPDAGWSRAQAAQVLGVSPGTVAQLTARGTLDHTPDGRISRRSVLARLARIVRATS